MSSTGVDVKLPPLPQLSDTIQLGLEQMGLNNAQADFEKAYKYSIGAGDPDTAVQTVFKALSLPNQYLAWAASRLGPNYLRDSFDKQGWWPSSIHEQKTFTDLFLESSGMERGDLFGKGAVPGALGVATDILTDPLTWVKPFRAAHHLSALEGAIKATRPEVVAKLSRLAELGLPELGEVGLRMMRDTKVLDDVKAAVRSGTPLLSADARTTAAAMRGDKRALAIVNNHERMNRELAQLDKSGWFDSPEAGKTMESIVGSMLGLKPRMGGIEATSKGIGRAISFTQEAKSLPTGAERTIAKGLYAVGAPARAGIEKMRKAMNISSGVVQFDWLTKVLAGVKEGNEEATIKAVDAIQAKVGRKLQTDEFLTAIDILEKPLAENPEQFAALQEIKKVIENNSYNRLRKTEQAVTLDTPLTEEQASFYSARRLSKDEAARILSQPRDQTGKLTDNVGRAYQVLDHGTAEDALRTSAFLDDMKRVPGIGATASYQTAKDAPGSTLIRLLTPDSALVSEPELGHLDAIQRVLAIAAQKGWGLEPGTVLSDAVRLGRNGTVQFVRPDLFLSFNSFDDALASSRAVAERYVAAHAPRTATLPILADAKVAKSITKKSVQASPEGTAMAIEHAINPTLDKVKQWDRAVLEGAAENVRYDFSADQLKAAEKHIAEKGSSPVIRVQIDPFSKVWLADEVSQLSLMLAARGERTRVPVLVTEYVGDTFRDLGAPLSAPMKVPILKGPSALFPDMSSPATEELMLSLRQAGLGDEQARTLASSRFIDPAGNEVLRFEDLSKQVRAETINARARLEVALNQLNVSSGGRLNVPQLMNMAFPVNGSTYDISRKGINDVLTMTMPLLKDRKELLSIVKTIEGLDTKLTDAYAFLSTLDPRALGHDTLFQLTSRADGALAVRTLGVPMDNYAAVGLHQGSTYAAQRGTHPLTTLVAERHPLDPGLVLGTDTLVPLGRMQKSMPAAVETISTEALKKEMRLSGKMGFSLSDAKRAELLGKGIAINPEGFIPARIPDTTVMSTAVTPNGSIIIGRGYNRIDQLAEDTFGAVYHPLQEFGRVDQNGVRLHNIQWGMMDTMTRAQVDRLNERMQLLAQRYVKAGVHPSKQFDVFTTLPMSYADKAAMFGEDIPKIGDVASGAYTVKLPKSMEGRMVDVADPLRSMTTTVRTAQGVLEQRVAQGLTTTDRASMHGDVQTWIDAYRSLVQDGLASEEIAAGLMLPESLRHGYYGRIMTPEAREAVDRFMQATAEENPSSPIGKLLGYANQFYGKRSFTQIGMLELDELINKGIIKTESGRVFTKEDLLKVKDKAGNTLATALKDHPEAYSYFVTDVQDAMMIRLLAGQRSIRHAQFHDALKHLAIPLMDGRQAVPIAEMRAIEKAYRAGEELTAEQMQLARLWTQRGHYQAVIDAKTARKLATEGQLSADVLDSLKHNEAMVPIEGAIFDDPRWKDGMVRFMPRDVIRATNQYFERISSLKSMNRLLAGYHSYLNLWKEGVLFTAPKFYARNAVGNLLLAWQGDLSPTNVAAYKEAHDVLSGYKQYTRYAPGEFRAGDYVLKAGGNAEKGISPKTVVYSINGESYTYGALVEEFNAHGGFYGMYHREYDRRLSNVLQGRGISNLNGMPLQEVGHVPKWAKPIDEALQPLAKFHEGMENHFRFAVFLHNWKNLGLSVPEAARKARTVLGGVTPLTSIERVGIAGLFPFYRWLRFSIPRHIMWHIERPEQVYRAWKAVQDIGRGGANVPEEQLPEWTRSHYNINVGKDKNGKWGILMLDGFWPATDLYRFTPGLSSDVPDMVGENFFGSVTPPLKILMEMGSNRRLPSGEQIEGFPGELSKNALTGWMPLKGMTRRPTTEGPLGALNLLWNESVFNTARPVREVGQLLGAFGQDKSEGIGDALRTYLIAKVIHADPQKALIAHQSQAAQTFRLLRGRLAQAQRDKNQTMIDYYRGQLTAHALLQGDPDVDR